MKSKNGIVPATRMVVLSVVIFGLLAVLIPGFAPASAVGGQSGIVPGQPQSRPRQVTDPPPSHDDDKAITLSADLVTVLISVTDGSGNLVNDLRQQDFEVLEDNMPQDMAGYYREDQAPLRLVFLFDTSRSIRHRFEFEQRAAAQFFRQVMRPGDQSAIYSVSTDSKLEVQFTSDVNALINALGRLKAEGATALYNSLMDAAAYIRPSQGRHVIVVLSDGSDTASKFSLAQSLTQVQKSDTMIYAVHSMGVAPSSNVQDLAGEFVLKVMSEETGGRAFYPPIYEDQMKEVKELEQIYKRIAAEVRAQYMITYYPKNMRRDGRFRLIQVKVKRPGLVVRARRGYYAPSR